MKNWRNRWKTGFTHEQISSNKNPVRDNVSQSEYQGVKIVHEWFSKDDIRQKYVQYAFQLWWIDFVKMLECENWNWSLTAIGDNWHAHGLCQAHDLYQKDIPSDFDTSWQRQVEYCYQKRSTWTIFYWPNRIIKWVKCSKYVDDRFTFVE